MTRINSDLNVKTLTDQHLMAEYRELPMVFASLRRSLRTQSTREVVKKIPPRFTLNTGHVTFFYNKLNFLITRYDKLIVELLYRGYNLDKERILDTSNIPVEFFKDWISNERDDAVVKQRIQEKINMKPTWYKYYSKPLTENFYNKGI